MNTWFTSDHHFHHRNVIKLCDRPFKDLDEMHKTLQDNWNSVVKDHDIVWVLGDFSFSQATQVRKVLKKLNGRIRLVKGNHDKGKGTRQMIEAGFEDVFENHYISINNIRVNLSHYPYYPKTKLEDLPDYVKRYLHKRMVDDGNFLLHGHTHSKEKRNGNMIHVGVDAWNFFPVSQKEIMELIGK